jgi:hypothetical protein
MARRGHRPLKCFDITRVYGMARDWTRGNSTPRLSPPAARVARVSIWYSAVSRSLTARRGNYSNNMEEHSLRTSGEIKEALYVLSPFDLGTDEDNQFRNQVDDIVDRIA